MTLRTLADSSTVVVTPPREVDWSTGGALAERLERARALQPSCVVVDFSAVTFCDSAAVTVLLSARRELQAQGCSLAVRNPPRMLQRIASVLGNHELLGIPAMRRPSDG